MTRSIQECYMTAVIQFYVIGTYMLRDTTGLTGNHVRLADIVKQRGLTMVNVTHHGYDRCARYQILLLILLLADLLGNLGAHKISGESVLIGHNVDGLGVQTLVD